MNNVGCRGFTLTQPASSKTRLTARSTTTMRTSGTKARSNDEKEAEQMARSNVQSMVRQRANLMNEGPTKGEIERRDRQWEWEQRWTMRMNGVSELVEWKLKKPNLVSLKNKVVLCFRNFFPNSQNRNKARDFKQVCQVHHWFHRSYTKTEFAYKLTRKHYMNS